MERKIGEIFEYNGEWYQTVKSQGKCCSCDFMIDGHCIVDFSSNGSCFYCHRKDKGNVIFKKLEKVGVPYEKRISDGTFSKFQRYKVYDSVILPKEPYIYRNFIDSTVEIEIKQTKDMGESSIKPFDLKVAKAGKPVCTRDGRKARIICFDTKGDMCPIIALVEENGIESAYHYDKNGKNACKNSELDLMMLRKKKEGWVNVYMEETNNNERLTGPVIYKTRKDAFDNACPRGYKATVKIEWEE